jgi:hypothetical protein
MQLDFLIVLFKNRKKRKIIKRYHTEKRALAKFNELIKENKSVLYPKLVENAEPSDYEIAILTNKTKIQKSLFLTDDLGRNIPVNLENPEYVFLKIEKYYIEEFIYDWQTKTKISLIDLVKKYCKTKDLKSIYTLNNKICIQIDSDVKVFSLKDKNESVRFLDSIQDYFLTVGRYDAIFVKDISSAQRKWIYGVLEDKGFEKKRLYRLKTTFSKR